MFSDHEPSGSHPVAEAPCIALEQVGKCYRLYNSSLDRIKQVANPRRKRYYQEFWALRHITLQVQRGETVGLIGRNGSGKSTLLQLICGILTPSEGRVSCNGRISALLELGTGFNYEFSGRDNLLINAALLGIGKQEVLANYEAILDFAEIGAFIDQPVKTYSSGMLVRLAFAIATSFTPEILVIDEALAVGDELFQRKCFGRIRDMQEAGTTILFVSHSGQNILDLCSRAVLLDRGELLGVGVPKLMLANYQNLIYSSAQRQQQLKAELKSELGSDGAAVPEATATVEHASAEQASAATSSDWLDPQLVSTSCIQFESRGATIDDLALQTLAGQPVNTISHGHTYRFSYTVSFSDDVEGVSMLLQIKRSNGLPISGRRTAPSAFHPDARAYAKGSRIKVSFEFHCTLVGDLYYINAAVMGRGSNGETFLARIVDAMVFKVSPIPEKTTLGIFASIERCTVDVLAGPAA